MDMSRFERVWQVCVYRPEVNVSVFLNYSSPFFLRQGLSVCLETINSAKPANQ